MEMYTEQMTIGKIENQLTVVSDVELMNYLILNYDDSNNVQLVAFSSVFVDILRKHFF